MMQFSQNAAGSDFFGAVNLPSKDSDSCHTLSLAVIYRRGRICLDEI